MLSCGVLELVQCLGGHLVLLASSRNRSGHAKQWNRWTDFLQGCLEVCGNFLLSAYYKKMQNAFPPPDCMLENMKTEFQCIISGMLCNLFWHKVDGTSSKETWLLGRNSHEARGTCAAALGFPSMAVQQAQVEPFCPRLFQERDNDFCRQAMALLYCSFSAFHPKCLYL